MLYQEFKIWLVILKTHQFLRRCKILNFFLKIILSYFNIATFKQSRTACLVSAERFARFLNFPGKIWYEMNSTLKSTLKIIGIIIPLLAIILFLLRYNTKAHSPEDTVTYSKGDMELEVFYNRPYKKDRNIFGGLVPYGEVWRTGANEATTFTTNIDLLVDGSLLEAGKYTLWTIPMENSWKVMFNSKMYPWGINLEEQAYRDPEFDVLVLEVPVRKTQYPLEQFTISFDEANQLSFMILAWDDTRILVPLQPAKK